MDYITNLRKYVGHDTLISLGATTLVFNDNKELLLNLRTDTKTWGIPGGSMELYETIEETAIRELKEETNINAERLELVTILSGNDYYFEYPNGGLFIIEQRAVRSLECVDMKHLKTNF